MTAKNSMSTPMNFKEGLADLMKDAAMARPHPSRVTSLPPRPSGSPPQCSPFGDSTDHFACLLRSLSKSCRLSP
jgi:hypothetical protein